ncbi:hypothetical protein G1H11_12780 [Phytoactinopolyspora alkaliphila]|uniref:Uncharacterized protein n=1 Tax=Phytoactinopolyspora alkaliphila TaxID=1783498 RepID=A0A6N9YML0_9ACTN|nr:hypothetical protein [Phytoactinopolyspora alkaliphila]NED96185.1 hypothetical protein [Phytoactinopolyspora alkaliphila]
MTQRPKYNRLVNEVHANGGFAGDGDAGNSAPFGRDGSLRNTVTENPYLAALVVSGAVALLAGIMLWGLGIDAYVYIGSERRFEVALAGAWLVRLGILLLVGWLTASAVCWQLRRPPST